MLSIEDIILKHSRRGMDILRDYLPYNYCRLAAEEILRWDKGTILLATGFYVDGYAETDGPAGTVILALALKDLGYCPTIITDDFCRGFFEMADIDVVYMDLFYDSFLCDRLLSTLKPVGMISVERCGINAKNTYENMRGISIEKYTAPIDSLFEKAYGNIPTIGIGDGGNEIGMGNLSTAISHCLNTEPCVVHANQLIIATVSNWGAYGLTAYLSILTHQNMLPEFARIKSFISDTVAMGSIDGVTKEHTVSVDGFDISIECEIITELRQQIESNIKSHIP